MMDRQAFSEADVLVKLGLSGRQARVYLALLKIGDATAKTISTASQVNRQDIHGVINSLQQIGLIQKKFTHPTTFQASPINEVLEELLRQKTTELSAIKNKAKHLKDYAFTFPNIPVLSTPCFGVISEGDKGKKYQNAILNTARSIDTITTYMQLRQITLLYETPLQNALQKGVQIRILTESSKQPLPKWVQNTSNLALKFLDEPSTAIFTIFDQNQVSIAINNSVNLIKGPNFWTNNPAMLTLSKTRFDMLWAQVQP
jgi:sugar-specific transcriptional regulator TrmB